MLITADWELKKKYLKLVPQVSEAHHEGHRILGFIISCQFIGACVCRTQTRGDTHNCCCLSQGEAFKYLGVLFTSE